MIDINVFALNSSRERPASTASGYAMLLILLLAIAVQVWGVVQLANNNANVLTVAAVIIGAFALIFIASGFYMLQPNQAAAITLFGAYSGTDGQPACVGSYPG